MTASVYDTLGFVCQVTLIPKKIQQQLCKMELDWDEYIPEKVAEEVVKLKSNLEELSKITIPRCFKASVEQDKNSKPIKMPSEMKVEIKDKTELHIFCDASELAYGAVAYLMIYNKKGSKVSFIMGKSRVAPIKTITIPRLELTAAVVATKLYQFVEEEIDMTLDQVFFWTDSQVVLSYLLNTSSRFKVFVANRIQAIQEISNVQDWHYVPTNLNPADLASRGIQPYETEKLKFWLQGPDFLQNTDYPQFDQLTQDENHDIEVKRVVVCEVKEHNFTYMLQYFSSYHKLQRSVIWWMRFIKYLKMCKEKKKPVNEPISVKEQEEADTRILQGVQQEEFPEEVKAVKMGLPVKTASKLASLCPIYGNGLLKVGGRQPSKHPVILPRHHVTDLFVKNVHERNGHVGIDHCRSYLRETVYILQSYCVVKKVVQSCYQCKKQHKRPMQQQMVTLPAERTNEYKPFINVGVDFFGPMYVKHGRGTAKRWGCLFTCLTTRAVRIEVAHSLSADSFIMAFQRFVARRGKPAKVWSDNGTNFTAGEKELRAEGMLRSQGRTR